MKEEERQYAQANKERDRQEIEDNAQEYLEKEHELNLHRKNYQQAYYNILQD